jgi:galactokinase
MIGNRLGDTGGVRMTGGGFGGCVVALVPQGRVDEIRALVEREYPAQTGLTAGIFVCTASQGAEQILA